MSNLNLREFSKPTTEATANQFSNYQQTLDCVERFLKATCIKQICTELCKGSCCQGCWEGDRACHKNEGVRLACSAFICPALKYFIRKGMKKSYEEDIAALAVFEALQAVIFRIDRYNETRPRYYNPYFDIPHKGLFEVYRINTTALEVIEQSTESMATAVADMMNGLEFCDFIDKRKQDVL